MAVIAQQPAQDDNSQIPPIFTYLGQFIDHDITAGTDRDQSIPVDADAITPRARSAVEASLVNFRDGRLDLDSLYGGGTDGMAQSDADQAFMTKLSRLMRFPPDPSQMRIAFYEDESQANPGDPSSVVDLPRDRAGDILRLGRLMQGASPHVTLAELEGLSDDMRKIFLNEDGSPNQRRAVIGDGRNDENLIVAQTHLAFLRLHNVLAQTRQGQIRDEGREPDPDAVFAWARQRVAWIYQWLVVNVYLPTLCDPTRLSLVHGSAAALYTDLLTRVDWQEGQPLPLPIEFSVGAFRFGHSMVRASYDWNTFFGRAVQGKNNILTDAPFAELFRFTGSGDMRGSTRLPGNWGADFPRLVDGPSTQTDRAARKIDTHIALPMSRLENGSDPVSDHLARRNLRRDHLLNVPSAQDCLAGLAQLDPDIPKLEGAALGKGDMGDVLDQGELRAHTPLWYYVLREAEVMAHGEHLGPLGTHLVAGTLIGLVVADQRSFWHQAGSEGGRWSPADLVNDGLPVVDSMQALLAVAGLYEEPG